jgi:hypothetical protein
MLPFCDRHIWWCPARTLPVWTRSFPISKEPKTLGEHLKKKGSAWGYDRNNLLQNWADAKRTIADEHFTVSLHQIWSCGHKEISNVYGEASPIQVRLGSLSSGVDVIVDLLVDCEILFVLNAAPSEIDLV